MKDQFERSKIEKIVMLEFERVISIAADLGLIPKESELDKSDLAYSLYQALLLYTKVINSSQNAYNRSILTKDIAQNP